MKAVLTFDTDKEHAAYKRATHADEMAALLWAIKNELPITVMDEIQESESVYFDGQQDGVFRLESNIKEILRNAKFNIDELID